MVQVTITQHFAGEAFLQGHYTTSSERFALVSMAIRKLSGALYIAHKVRLSEARLILEAYKGSLRAQEAIMLLVAFPGTPSYRKIRRALLSIVFRAPVKYWMDTNLQTPHAEKYNLYEWWPIHALKTDEEMSMLVDKILSQRDIKCAQGYAGILQSRTRRVCDDREVMTELSDSWLSQSHLDRIVSFLGQ